MGKLTANDQKAIGWWAEQNNLMPQLSAPPTIRFKYRQTGKISEANMVNLRARWERWREEQKRKRKKKQEA